MNAEIINLIYAIKNTTQEQPPDKAIGNYTIAINLLTKHMINQSNFSFPQNIPDFIKFINNEPINSYLHEELNDKPFISNGNINEAVLKEINEGNEEEEVQKNMYKVLTLARDKSKKDFDFWSNAYLNARTFIGSNYCISKRDFHVALNRNFAKEFIPYIKNMFVTAGEILGEMHVCPVCGRPITDYDKSEGQCSAVCNYYINSKNLTMEVKTFNEKMIKLHHGIYKYILLPGIAEKLIYENLKDKFKEYEVILYPNIDEFDISISSGLKKINLDVKDVSAPQDLVKILEEKSDVKKFIFNENEKSYLVIPNHRVRIFKKNENRNYINELQAIMDNKNINLKVIQEKNLVKLVKEWIGEIYE